jgi:EmrB/QacA subfamily drug resistance transporter
VTALAEVPIVDQTVHRWRAFAVLAVAYFMTIVDLTIVNVALPTIGRKLHFSETNLQWVVTAYGLTFGGFLLLGGRAADLLGRRRILLLGLAIFTAASLACALATTDAFLIAMRGIQGLGAATVLPAALSIVMNMFPEGAERNKALGAWGGIGASGATIGLIAGGLLTRYVGWEYIFFLNVPIGAAAIVIARRIVPESRLDAKRRRYDPFGAVTVTAGLLLLVYALSQAPQHGWSSVWTVSLLAVAAALVVSFLAIESRAEAPLLPLRILRHRTVAGANAVGLLLGASFFGFIFVGTLYMQQVLGYSAIETGLAWLAASVTSVALAALSQALVGRVSAKVVMAVGMALIGGGILWATAAPVHGRFWSDLAGPFFVAGAGTAFAFIPVSIAALAGIASREAGVASGLLNTSQQIGGAIGVAVASTIAATHFRTLTHDGSAVPAALTGGFQWALWVCGAIGLAAIPVALLLIGRERRGHAEASTLDARPALTPLS